MTGVDVHDDVGKVEGLERVRDALLVATLGLLASADIGVGDQVRQGVGLDDQGKRLVGVLLEDAGDHVDVLRLVLADLANRELAVGGLGGAVTAGEIVDDETQDVLAGDVGRELRLQLVDVGDGVEPEEGADVANLLRGRLEALIAEVLDGGLDLGLVKGVGVQLVRLEHIVAATELDGRGAGSLLDRRGEGSGEGGQSQNGSGSLHVEGVWRRSVQNGGVAVTWLGITDAYAWCIIYSCGAARRERLPLPHCHTLLPSLLD